MSKDRNQLHKEKSPYLLQHKDNPVHWYAWGEEAFQASRDQGKPIFLSVGYSTCHWCHVMAHESFEDDEVAEVLNKNFISIKVDREERPDVDEIYMGAVHAMGQRGGWPLNMFLTPDLKPFFGGTYWPKPQFIHLLEHMAKLWREDRSKVENSGESLVAHLKEQRTLAPSQVSINEESLKTFFQNSLVNYDRAGGGFGGAPKFPHAMQLSMLLRIYRRSDAPEALQMVIHTLEKMARGGLNDHLGGGFARYSVDGGWMIPHFEKMLYDNALLAVSYLEVYQLSKITMFERVARETLDYILGAMTHPEGGFYSAEDADSEGAEGKFYVWSMDELKDLLTSEEFEHVARVYGVSPQGNFEGKNHFNLNTEFGWDEKDQPLIKSASEKLLKVREVRVHPYKDDKILTGWNGLMIRAMAMAFQVTGEQKYLEAAHRAREFIHQNLFKEGGLLARYRDGEGRFAARLEDYAFLIQGLIDLYQCDFNGEVLKWAGELQGIQDEIFWDNNEGAYFFTDGKDPSLLLRSKEGMDGALPNANGVSAHNLLRLHDFYLEPEFLSKAEKIFQVFSVMATQHPHAFAQMIIAYDYYSDSSKEVAIIENPQDGLGNEFLQKLREEFYPNLVLAKAEGEVSFPKLLSDRKALGGSTTFYICQDNTCNAPTGKVDEAMEQIQQVKKYSLA